MAGQIVRRCIMSFYRLPSTPYGDREFEAWMRAFLRKYKAEFIVEIKGAKRTPLASGGVSYSIPAARGGASVSGWHDATPLELPVAPYPAYDAQSVIHIQSSHNIVVTGVKDAENPTGPLIKSRPGMWVSFKAVPAQSGDVWNLPQFPLPNPNNWDDPLNFWRWLGEQYC